MESQTNFYSHLFGNKNILAYLNIFGLKIVEKNFLVYPSKHLLGKISVSTFIPRTTFDVLIVISFNISCLILVGVLHNRFSYNFQQIAIIILWCYDTKLESFQLNLEKDKLLNNETSLTY